MQDLVDGLNILVRGRMKHNDNSAKETDSATELAQNTQFLLEEIGAKTAPINTDKAPNGVTRMAGANAYAAKLQISPTTTVRTACVNKGFV